MKIVQTPVFTVACACLAPACIVAVAALVWVSTCHTLQHIGMRQAACADNKLPCLHRRMLAPQDHDKMAPGGQCSGFGVIMISTKLSRPQGVLM
jgi:hypothetical protein